MPTPTPKYRPYYYPFGSSIKSRGYSAGSGFRFGFGGQLKDFDIKAGTSCYYTFYRILDVNITNWFTTDPLAQFIASQYSSFMDNPINKMDPNGGWIPSIRVETSNQKSTNTNEASNQRGYLVAQKEIGDNEKTLAEFLNIPVEESLKIFKTADKNGVVQVPLNISKPINDAIQHSLDNPDDYGGYFDKNYNCFASAIFTSQGQFPLEHSSINYDYPNGYDFVQKILSDEYENISEKPGAIKFGRTIIRLGKDVDNFFQNYNMTEHACIFLGKSKNGTVYVFTKNGWKESPKVSTLQQTLNIYQGSKVQGAGPKKNEGGLYNYIGPGGL